VITETVRLAIRILFSICWIIADPKDIILESFWKPNWAVHIAQANPYHPLQTQRVD
jgi:hypothetical protein